MADDDKVWRSNLTRFFSHFGYEVTAAASCAEAKAAVLRERPDCVLLDFHMEDGDGGRLCLDLRATAAVRRTPVVMVSADPAEEMNAYTAYKADGFILKGCPLDKIRAVAESVLRRVDMERGALESGDLRLEPDGCRVFRKGREVLALPPEQFRLLALLMEASPGPVGEAEISALVLGAGAEKDAAEAVYSLVYRLRRSLGPQLSLRVKNVSGRGWCYVLPRVRDGGA